MMIVIGKDTENEIALTVSRNLGPANWAKDAKIMAYGAKLSNWSDLGEGAVIMNVSEDVDFPEMFSLMFDQEVDLNHYPLMDVFRAFMEGFRSKSDRIASEDVQVAEKK